MSQSSGDPGGTSVFPKKTRFSVRVANVPTREDLDGEDPAKSAEDELEPLNPGGSGFRLRGISECQEDAAAAEAGHSAYTTQYLKSLRHYLTRDALPNENHYRNILSVNSPKNLRKYSRPTLEELQENDTPKEEPKVMKDPVKCAKKSKMLLRKTKQLLGFKFESAQTTHPWYQ